MKSALEELCARARAMDAGIEERDALLRELSRLPGPEESPRRRADGLLRVIADPWLGGFRGSEGRRVDRVAALSLLAMGEPYASELPAHIKDQLAHPEPLPASAASPAPAADTPPRRGTVGRVIATGIGSIELLFLFWDHHRSLTSILVGGGIIVSSTLLPAFTPRARHDSPLDRVRRFGLVMLGLITLVWSLFALGTLLDSHPDRALCGFLTLVAALHLVAHLSLYRMSPPAHLAERPAERPTELPTGD